MIPLQGNGLAALSASPDIPGADIPNIQPDIVGGMSVANNFNPAKPFMDMQQAITEARIKQEALAQQQAQSERSLAMQEARLNQDEAQFQQSMQLDQQKLKQQAEQAQITQKINMEKLQLEKFKQDIEMQDWTDKRQAQQLLASFPGDLSEVLRNPDKFNPEDATKVTAAMMVADSKSYWSFFTEKYKTDTESQLSQKKLAALQASIPLLAEASDESVELARLGKSPAEALKPITNALNKGITEGNFDYDTAKDYLKFYVDSKKEVTKQYKKLQGEGGAGTTYYLNGNPVDQATAMKNPGKVDQVNNKTGRITVAKPEEEDVFSMFKTMYEEKKSKKGSKK